MNKIIFSLCVGLIASISIFLVMSYDVYYMQENSTFVLSQVIFENSFIQNAILVSIPTAIAFITSFYVTNTWQIRKEKLEIQRKILNEVDDSIVNYFQILNNFDKTLWIRYAIWHTTIKPEDGTKICEIAFPTEKSEQPNPKFEKEHDDFLTKYVEEAFELWKFSSTIKLYYEEKVYNDFKRIIENLNPAYVALERLYNSKNISEFNTYHEQFMSEREKIQSQIIKFKEDLINEKIKKLNV